MNANTADVRTPKSPLPAAGAFFDATHFDAAAAAAAALTTDVGAVAPEVERATRREALVANRIPFGVLCRVFERTDKAKRGNQKLAALGELCTRIRAAPGASAADFFAVMRLALPELDTERLYGVKELKLAAYYIELTDLTPNGSDATRLREWRDPADPSAAVRFSDIVYSIACRRGLDSLQPGATALTVGDINAHLTGLSVAHAKADGDAKKRILRVVFRNTTAVEQKWLVRIIMKSMCMGANHLTIFHAFDPAAIAVYNSTMSMREVFEQCDVFRGPAVSDAATTTAPQAAAGIRIGLPFRPMLALLAPDTAKLMALVQNTKTLIEPKYDGERMMVHVRAGGVVQLWTRNAVDYSARYGPRFNAKFLRQLRGVESCILDGEMLLYDSVTDACKPFGQNATFAVRKDGERAPRRGRNGAAPTTLPDDGRQWYLYVAFDMVFLNGESLANLSLERRKQLLANHVVPLPKHVELVPTETVSCDGGNPATILAALNRHLGQGHEGIVLKQANAPYVPGDRSSRWMKLKGDQVVGLGDTVDLVVLGGFYGTKFGERRVSHFLLGVRDDTASALGSSEGDADTRYVTVCKVGTGYNSAELGTITARLESKWLKSDDPPAWLGGWRPAADDLPDVYILPSDSLVMEVLGYSFVDTEKFLLGTTIRFPRFQRMRYDKTVADATTLSQIRAMVKTSTSSSLLSAAGKRKADTLTELVMQRTQRRQRREAADADSRVLTMPRRTFGSASDVIICVPTADRSAVAVATSNLFAGYEFCILFPDRPGVGGVNDRRAIHALIEQHGGTVVAHPQRHTGILLSTTASNDKLRHWVAGVASSASALKYDTTDVVLVQWLTDCVARSVITPLEPRYMAYASPRLVATFKLTLDEFDDSYYDPCTDESLRVSIDVATAKYRAARRLLSAQAAAPTTARNAGTAAAPLVLGTTPYAKGANMRAAGMSIEDAEAVLALLDPSTFGESEAAPASAALASLVSEWSQPSVVSGAPGGGGLVAFGLGRAARFARIAELLNRVQGLRGIVQREGHACGVRVPCEAASLPVGQQAATLSALLQAVARGEPVPESAGDLLYAAAVGASPLMQLDVDAAEV